MQSSNPAFSDSFVQNWEQDYAATRTMTVQGTAVKTMVLFAILSLTAGFSWSQVENGQMSYGLAIGSGIVAFIVAMVTCFKPTWAPVTAPLYAAFEGVFLGVLSRAIEFHNYPGIVGQAVGLTFAVMFLMLVIYATGLIKVTGQFAAAIGAATGGLCLFYLVAMLLNMFGGISLPVFGSSPIGIGFSALVVGLAAFNLMLDFDFIEKGSRANFAKSMEWYGAFGLMVTLVWLYLEILQLLRKLNDRR